jgi:hypothetical protein
VALGTNTLGLLFKIGVDAKDVNAALDSIVGQNKNLRKEIEAGMEAESKAFLSLGDNVKNVTPEFNKLVTQANQFRRGLEEFSSGNIGAGFANLTRAAGAAGIAIGAIATAAAAAGLAIKGMLDTAEEVGTRTKEDFEELQKQLADVGFKLTEVDHAIAQGVTKSITDLKSAVTAVFVDLLRESGPALIVLLKQVTQLVKDLGPLIKDVVGGALREVFIQFATDVKTVRDILALLKASWLSVFALDPAVFQAMWDQNFKIIKAQVDKTRGELTKGLFTPGDVDTSKQEEAIKAQIDLLHAQTGAAKLEFDAQLRLLKENFEAGSITRQQANDDAEEAGNKYLAALDHQTDEEKRLNAELFLLQNKRALTTTELATRDTEAANQRIEDYVKMKLAVESFGDSVLAVEEKYDSLKEKQRKLAQDIELFWVKAGEEINKAVQKPVEIEPGLLNVQDPAIIAGIHAQAEALDPLTKAWRDLKLEVRDAAGVFTDELAAALEPTKILTDLMTGLANALQSTFENFILTGKSGAQAFRTLAAAVLSSLAVQAIAYAISEHAKATSDTASAIDALAVGDFMGFLLYSLGAERHTHAALLWGLLGAGAGAAGLGIGLAGGLGGGGASAAAGAGGFGGSAAEQQPSPVNITLGGNPVSTLAIAVNKLHDKISSMSPGDVVTVAADQKPEAFAAGTLEAGRRNGAFTREFMQISGART